MQLVIVQHAHQPDGDNHCLQAVLRSDPGKDVLTSGLLSQRLLPTDRSVLIGPDPVGDMDSSFCNQTVVYDRVNLSLLEQCIEGRFAEEPLVLIDAQSPIKTDIGLVEQALRSINTDVLVIIPDASLHAYREQVRLTPANHIVGYRRLYADTIEPSEQPVGRPYHIILKPSVIQLIKDDPALLLDFSKFIDVASKKVRCRFLRVAAKSLNLSLPQNMLTFLEEVMIKTPTPKKYTPVSTDGIRFYGPVWVDRSAVIEKNAVLIGPVILSQAAVIKSHSIIHRALIGPGALVRQNESVNNHILYNDIDFNNDSPTMTDTNLGNSPNSAIDYWHGNQTKSTFRCWSNVSYAGWGKRLFDILFSLVVLMLFLPIFPIIAVIIKLTSEGPVLYKAKRQGLHGREFGCLKFRTMVVKADAMQEKLQLINQVDGPQFKIDYDPRISGVGKFLRDTSIDEIPQFINVLLGQMSVVGPRPSPEKENMTCPSWREARLSVRPGITGRWQVYRTRQQGLDFQEWVYHDTEYVRNLSFKTDMLICYKTAQYLINTVLDQFS